MTRAAAFLPFVFLAFLSWGNYGPLMHHGNLAMGDALRPFVGVGFAYFLIAVVVPFLMLRVSGEKGAWSRDGITFSLVAGAVGALGALGVIVAFSVGAKPVYVMPLVFGGAPVVNTLVTMAMGKNFEKIRPIFLAGILMAAVGGAGVLFFRPGPAPAAATATVAAKLASATPVAVSTPAAASSPAAASTEVNFPIAIAAIIGAILSWGSYGPMLHKGQMKMGGSRLRPFLCVGIAYFFIAVAMPMIALAFIPTNGAWTQAGLLWSLAGGAAGALGALGIIYAFNFGGKPIFVMPLIFGLAPIMNTITTLTENGSWGRIDAKFVAALLITIAGAVTVLVTAPKQAAKPAGSPGSENATVPGLNTPASKLAST